MTGSRSGLLKVLLFGTAVGALLVGLGASGLLGKALATLSGFLGASAVMPGIEPTPAADHADLSVFSRASARPGSSLLVQALLHLPEASDPTPVALMADPGAKLKARRSLLLPLARGDRVDLVIAAPDCVVEDPRETIVWRGSTEAASFLVQVPADFADESLHMTVNAFRNGEPLGRISFAVPVDSGTAAREIRLMGDEARRYGHAFVSYASADRPTVVRYAHAWSVMRQSYFQDFLSLEPGDAWETRLVEEIDRSDVLVLFWSQAASRSDHVRREVEYALERRRSGQAIEILPVIIDGPPPAPPPESLSSIHFNDRHAYVVASVMQEAAVRAP